MPAGRSTTGSCAAALCSSAFWMRRSMSRIASRYSSSLPRSVGPRPRCSRRDVLGRPSRECCGPPACRAQPRRRVGAVAVAEQPLEHRARLDLHRQRRRRRPPRERVAVGAAVAGVARAEEVVGIAAELERGQLRLAAELPGGDLVHRHPGLDVGALRSSSDARRSGSRPPRAHDRRRLRPAAGRRFAAPGRSARAADPETAQRLQRRRQLEVRALGRRRPPVHDDAVRHVDDAQAADGLRGRAGARRTPGPCRRAAAAPSSPRGHAARFGATDFFRVMIMAQRSSVRSCRLDRIV